MIVLAINYIFIILLTQSRRILTQEIKLQIQITRPMLQNIS